MHVHDAYVKRKSSELTNYRKSTISTWPLETAHTLPHVTEKGTEGARLCKIESHFNKEDASTR